MPVDPGNDHHLAMTTKAIIFDWDLTLWNSWDIHVWLMQYTAGVLGVARPHPPEIAREFHRPFFEHLAWFLGADHDRIVETYTGMYHEVVAEKAHLYAGVAETLRRLKEWGFQTAVFSDKRHAFGESELAQTGVGALLDHTLFLHDGRPYKPDPAGLLQVIEALGVSPQETLYVGDSHQDIECARRAGVRSAAALWGSLNRERVLAQIPDHRLESVAEMNLSHKPAFQAEVGALN